jgi:DNA-binding transcriptional MerR regulator
MPEHWRIRDFAKLVGRHQNTVDAWFKQMEQNRIHYVNRTSNEKVYDQVDLNIAKHIKGLRDEKWALEAIFDSLPDRFELRPFPPEAKDSVQNAPVDIEALKKALTEEIRDAVKQEISQQLERQEQLMQERLDNAWALYRNARARHDRGLMRFCSPDDCYLRRIS